MLGCEFKLRGAMTLDQAKVTDFYENHPYPYCPAG